VKYYKDIFKITLFLLLCVNAVYSQETYMWICKSSPKIFNNYQLWKVDLKTGQRELFTALDSTGFLHSYTVRRESKIYDFAFNSDRSKFFL